MTLDALIRAELQAAGGWLAFDRFMSLALYAPGLGYYSGPQRKFGQMPGGGSDFVTAPEMSPLFGRALAAQIRQALEITGVRTVVEFGAGSGALAEQILGALGGLIERYRIVELSADLRGRQQERLAHFGRTIEWLDRLPDTLEAVVVGNEVLDAMPVQLLAFDGEAWRERIRRAAPLINSLLIIALVYLADAAAPFGSFPGDWRLPLRDPIDAAVAWMRDNLYQIGDLPIGTGPLSDFMTIYLLNPMRTLLRDLLPWPVVTLGLAALAGWAGGGRLALLAALGMLAIGLLGMWSFSMDTFSQVIVTMAVTAAVALPLGVLASQNATVRDLLRPILDFLQTIPTFVYLVPVIMLFNVGRVPGLIAAALYAIPPGIKLTELGIRQVPGEVVEAARAFGATRRQTIFKVQLPLALPAIMLGVNQMIMMVLAMVIIAGLVGGEGLGLEAVSGLARNQTGRGIESGLAIVILAIILDRITQAWAARQA